jgi:hypothetical protein
MGAGGLQQWLWPAAAWTRCCRSPPGELKRRPCCLLSWPSFRAAFQPDLAARTAYCPTLHPRLPPIIYLRPIFCCTPELLPTPNLPLCAEPPACAQPLARRPISLMRLRLRPISSSAPAPNLLLCPCACAQCPPLRLRPISSPAPCAQSPPLHLRPRRTTAGRTACGGCQPSTRCRRSLRSTRAR